MYFVKQIAEKESGLGNKLQHLPLPVATRKWFSDKFCTQSRLTSISFVGRYNMLAMQKILM